MDKITELMKDAAEQLKSNHIPVVILTEIEINTNDTVQSVVSRAEDKYSKTQYGQIEITKTDIERWAADKKAEIEKYG